MKIKQFLKDVVVYSIIGFLAFYTIFDIKKELKPKYEGAKMPSIEGRSNDDNDLRRIQKPAKIINRNNISEFYQDM